MTAKKQMKTILGNVVREMIASQKLYADPISDPHMKAMAEGGTTAYYDVYMQLVRALVGDVAAGSNVTVDQEGNIAVRKVNKDVN